MRVGVDLGILIREHCLDDYSRLFEGFDLLLFGNPLDAKLLSLAGWEGEIPDSSQVSSYLLQRQPGATLAPSPLAEIVIREASNLVDTFEPWEVDCELYLAREPEQIAYLARVTPWTVIWNDPANLGHPGLAALDLLRVESLDDLGKILSWCESVGGALVQTQRWSCARGHSLLAGYLPPPRGCRQCDSEGDGGRSMRLKGSALARVPF